MLRAYRSADVRAAEEPALSRGEPLMERAAFAIATQVARSLGAREHRVTGSQVLALVGPGNNGGDALFAGALLARRGAQITALTFGTPHEEGRKAAEAAGVRMHDARSADLRALANASGVWIDGLLGIGARPPLNGPMAEAVRLLEAERRASPDSPIIIAVDCPSGIGVDDGTLPGPYLQASVTVTMGLMKPGLLLPPAHRACGRIELADIGLPQPGHPAAATLTGADVSDLLTPPGPGDHKYSRGVVLLGVGSTTYPGAAILAASGALRGGAGMVRLVAPRRVEDLVLAAHPEVVCQTGHAQATVLGSGVDDPEHLRPLANRALADGYPLVLDAGALGLLADGYEDLPSTCVLTPHPGELSTLLHARGEPMSRDEISANPARAARLAAAITGATVVLKGATDVIAGPDGPVYAQPAPSHWRATAGAGDVLAGLIGALLATRGEEIKMAGRGHGRPALLAAAACFLHGRAADRVGITAHEIAQRLPQTLEEVL
ncbi:MAG: NAD(P)H-hydrate dehydratase [Flaviflexus sp.]|nr:NAD(P)H-hydrate dehydratase [Flaviflexus sp.]